MKPGYLLRQSEFLLASAGRGRDVAKGAAGHGLPKPLLPFDMIRNYFPLGKFAGGGDMICTIRLAIRLCHRGFNAMTTFLFKSAAIAALLLVAIPIGSAAAQAQATGEEDFIRYGDYFPEASYPMSALEKQLFEDIQGLLEKIHAQGPGSSSFMPGATKSALLSVHLNKKNNLLVNMSRKILPRTEFMDDDQFYFGLTILIGRLVEKQLNIKYSSETEDSTSPPRVYFVFDRKTAKPDDYRTEVVESPQAKS
jgi:hypothetical protein